MKFLEYKHFFEIKNGVFIWEDPDMLEYKRKNLEGKRGFATIQEVIPGPSPNQYAYYFGGIIRSECLSSNTFAGWTEYEVHEVLLAELRSHTKVVEMADGKTIVKTVTDDFSKYDKEDMRLYIEELIPHLLNNYGIVVKPSEYYKYNKYRIDPKTFT